MYQSQDDPPVGEEQPGVREHELSHHSLRADDEEGVHPQGRHRFQGQYYISGRGKIENIFSFPVSNFGIQPNILSTGYPFYDRILANISGIWLDIFSDIRYL